HVLSHADIENNPHCRQSRRNATWGLFMFRTVILCVGAVSLVMANEASDQPTLGAPVYAVPAPPVPWSPPALMGKPLPINLPTALKLVNARAMDIAIAAQRIQQASAQFEQAKYAWLPTITMGADYMRHDGRFQEAGGGIINPSRSSFMAGAGVNAIFTPADAIFAPLAARQVVRARQADLDTAANNSVVAVAE